MTIIFYLWDAMTKDKPKKKAYSVSRLIETGECPVNFGMGMVILVMLVLMEKPCGPRPLKGF